MSEWRRLTLSLRVLLAALVLGGAGRSAYAEDCITDWGAAGAIVRAQKLLGVGDLTQQAAQDFGGQIIKATLCKDGDDYVYKLVVRMPNGQLKTVVVDARAKARQSNER